MDGDYGAKFGCVHKTLHGDGKDTLGRAVLTCEQMLRDRGCTRIARAPDPDASIENGTPPILRGEGDDLIVEVYVHSEDQVGVKFVRSVLEVAEGDVIVVSLEGPTPFTKKECDGKRIQFFTMRDVCVNITRHALVPKHEKMEQPPPGMRVEHLPLLLDTDPIVQYYNWPHGTIVRVWRTFGGHEPTPYFRVVSPATS